MRKSLIFIDLVPLKNSLRNLEPFKYLLLFNFLIPLWLSLIKIISFIFQSPCLLHTWLGMLFFWRLPKLIATPSLRSTRPRLCPRTEPGPRPLLHWPLHLDPFTSSLDIDQVSHRLSANLWRNQLTTKVPGSESSGWHSFSNLFHQSLGVRVVRSGWSQMKRVPRVWPGSDPKKTPFTTTSDRPLMLAVDDDDGGWRGICGCCGCWGCWGCNFGCCGCCR